MRRPDAKNLISRNALRGVRRGLTTRLKEGDTMITAETRRESHYQTDKSTRYRMILEAYRQHGHMTAREVGQRLGFTDLNAVKPRITELCDCGLLRAVGKKYDQVTNRNVAVFEISDKPEPK